MFTWMYKNAVYTDAVFQGVAYGLIHVRVHDIILMLYLGKHGVNLCMPARVYLFT